MMVENAIANIKDFHATKATLHFPLSDWHVALKIYHKIWTVIAVLVNKYKSL